ncbi:LysR substrate-binding domain-containing protein [Agromyces sp. H3Y2-19a]|jgi:DNA-binding transcriptional LysR family regulator|uniref:LysR substrate-binding domain-containing protein n=1 Tax=Agromyces TaxID=33877 RepID=UPI0023B8EBED|nr:LysR substrate-binding domain-containing protein [Agromyces chromiiresistens]MDF0513997.1 LysR substrate-binding domain-containing protein [Agromyces chromiiresistens]
MATDRLLDGRLKIRHLVLVTTIADEGTLVRAAEALHITQPVVTRGLREAEEILGVPLFERLPRGVTPTEYGRPFIERARSVLAELRVAGEEVRLLQSGQLGTVTVGTHLAGSNLLLPRAIAGLKREHPRLTVVVREGTPDTLQQLLLAGDLDLTVGRLSSSVPVRLEQERLHQEPIRLVARAGHPVHHRSTALADLVAYPWIFPVAQTALRAELEAVFFHEGLPLPADRVECTSMLTLRNLLVTTDVIAALPMFIAVDDKELRLLPTALSSIRRSVGVTMPKDRAPSAAAAALLAHLREEGARLAEFEREHAHSAG